MGEDETTWSETDDATLHSYVASSEGVATRARFVWNELKRTIKRVIREEQEKRKK